MRTHQELISLTSESTLTMALAFSPDGNKIVGLNNDGRLHIWRAPSREEVAAAELDGTKKDQQR